MEELVVRVWAIGILIVAAIWIRRRGFTYGIEGEEPAGTITGRVAVGCGIVVALLSVFILIWPTFFS